MWLPYACLDLRFEQHHNSKGHENCVALSITSQASSYLLPEAVELYILTTP